MWVAEIEGEVCGFMSVLGDMLEQLYILPAYQGQGIGSELLGKAIEIADAPMRLWVFQRNEPARKFYEDRGFAPILFTDGVENEEKTPDVLYRFRDHNQISPE